MSEKTAISRRDFLNISLPFLAGVVSACTPHSDSPSFLTPTLEPSPRPTAVPTPKTFAETPEAGWKIPTPEQIRAWAKDPGFWSKKLGPSQNPIFVDQWDPNQYPGYSNPEYSLPGFMNNACVLASLTMARRWSHYIFTGDIPTEINIMQTLNSLIGKTYVIGRHKNENLIIDPDRGSLINLFAIKTALEVLDSETHYYTVVETTPKPVFSDCTIPPRKGKRKIETLCVDNPIPYGEWQGVFDKTITEVTSQGGLPLFFVYKYGWGHVSLFPDIPQDINEDVLVLDPRGANEKGFIAKMPITKYTKAVAYGLGVVPNLPNQSSWRGYNKTVNAPRR